jgi:hypothetical protein
MVFLAGGKFTSTPVSLGHLDLKSKRAVATAQAGLADMPQCSKQHLSHVRTMFDFQSGHVTPEAPLGCSWGEMKG